MLTLEDAECEDIPSDAVDVPEEGGHEGGYKEKVGGRILRTALLTRDEDSDSQEDELSEELLSMDGSEVSNESATSDWDDIKNETPISCIASAHNGKEFIIITRLGAVEEDDASVPKKLAEEHPVSEKSSKSRRRSKRHKKVILLRKLLPNHEPIVEIKEEEHSIVATEVDDCMPIMEDVDYEEASVDHQDMKDSKDNISWLKSLRPLPLYYTDRGKPYLKCPSCGAMFFTSNSFQKHLYSHMYKEEDAFVCSFCNYTNAEPGMLFAHLSKHQDQCEFCNENLMRKNNFEKHWDIHASSFTMKRDHRGRFVCTLCNLVFDLLPQLEKHWFKHACKRERTYQCKECSGLYESIETLNNHKCMKCPVCGKVYDSLHKLKAHTVWTKHNLKCPICSYEFILTMDHEKHLALHRQTYRLMNNFLHCLQSADGKTFQCNLCDKIFYALPTLILHLQEDHGIKNVKKETKADECMAGGNMEPITEILLGSLKK